MAYDGGAGTPREKLAEILNDGQSRIRLVESDDGEGAAPPEQCDSVAENWVFCVCLPGYCDSLFWAVVPRNGEPAYNYGFN